MSIKKVKIINKIRRKEDFSAKDKKIALKRLLLACNMQECAIKVCLFIKNLKK